MESFLYYPSSFLVNFFHWIDAQREERERFVSIQVGGFLRADILDNRRLFSRARSAKGQRAARDERKRQPFVFLTLTRALSVSFYGPTRWLGSDSLPLPFLYIYEGKCVSYYFTAE